MADTSAKDLVFVYLFKHPDHKEHAFEIHMNPTTMSLLPPPNFNPPSWAKENKFVCSVCPKIKPDHKICKTCYNISHIVEEFKAYQSYEEVNIIVKSPDRRYVFTGDM